MAYNSRTRRRRRRRRRKRSKKRGKRGGGNGSSSSSSSGSSSSAAGPGSWINELSTRDSTLSPSWGGFPSTQSSSTESSFYDEPVLPPRPGDNMHGYGVGEDIQLQNGCEVANRSCDCIIPWKTGVCTYDEENKRIYCKCQSNFQRAAEQAKGGGKTRSKKQRGGRRRRSRRKRRTRKQRGGWFGSNWFGTWGQKPKENRLIKGAWSSKGMSCNPYLPLQCPGGLKCIPSGWGIGPFSFGGKCVMR